MKFGAVKLTCSSCSSF